MELGEGDDLIWRGGRSLQAPRRPPADGGPPLNEPRLFAVLEDVFRGDGQLPFRGHGDDDGGGEEEEEDTKELEASKCKSTKTARAQGRGEEEGSSSATGRMDFEIHPATFIPKGGGRFRLPGAQHEMTWRGVNPTS